MHHRSIFLASFVWMVLVLAGTWWLNDYASRPGTAAVAPESWPTASTISRAIDRPTLMLFVHPQCSCSQASLRELEHVVAQSGGPEKMKVMVVFYAPEAMTLEWVEGPLWRHAGAIPGVERIKDPGGRLTEAFGAFTSGQTLFYDASGMLRFEGGITGARAHEGDNLGRQAVVQLVRNHTSSGISSFVFGCAIQGKEWVNAFKRKLDINHD